MTLKGKHLSPSVISTIHPLRVPSRSLLSAVTIENVTLPMNAVIATYFANLTVSHFGRTALSVKGEICCRDSPYIFLNNIVQTALPRTRD